MEERVQGWHANPQISLISLTIQKQVIMNQNIVSQSIKDLLGACDDQETICHTL